MSFWSTLPTLALYFSGAMILITSPLAVMELRYEAHRRQIRRIQIIPAPRFPETRAAIHNVSVTKVTDKRRRTYAVSPYLGPVPTEIDALPAPDEVPEDQKL